MLSKTENEIRLIVFDVDGTLVASDKKLSDYTMHVIKEVKEKYNVSMMIASSRMPSSIQKIQNQLNFTSPFISYDGAYVEDEIANGTFPDYQIDLKITRSIVEVASNLALHVGLFHKNCWYVREIDYWTLREVRGTKVWPEVSPVEDIIKRWDSEQVGPHKIMIRGYEQDISKMTSFLSHQQNSYISISQNQATTLEISNANANKWNALQKFLALHKILEKHVMAFGDGENDIEIIRHVGFGIAMENAVDEAKKCCREMTLTNDEDGVAYMLRKYFQVC